MSLAFWDLATEVEIGESSRNSNMTSETRYASQKCLLNPFIFIFHLESTASMIGLSWPGLVIRTSCPIMYAGLPNSHPDSLL